MCRRLPTRMLCLSSCVLPLKSRPRNDCVGGLGGLQLRMRKLAAAFLSSSLTTPGTQSVSAVCRDIARLRYTRAISFGQPVGGRIVEGASAQAAEAVAVRTFQLASSPEIEGSCTRMTTAGLSLG